MHAAKIRHFIFFKGCLHRYIHEIRKLLVNAPKIEVYVMEIKEIYSQIYQRLFL